MLAESHGFSDENIFYSTIVQQRLLIMSHPHALAHFFDGCLPLVYGDKIPYLFSLVIIT